MGWMDCHLHSFYAKNPKTGYEVKIGIPGEDFGQDIVPGWQTKVSNYVNGEKSRFHYTYDFGDNWDHVIVLEKILTIEEDKVYPVCIAGKRACPPENIGSIPCYEMLCESISNPKHKDHRAMLDQYGEYLPDAFKPESVEFDSPKDRLKFALENFE
jgi:hypothetical protein